MMAIRLAPRLAARAVYPCTCLQARHISHSSPCSIRLRESTKSRCWAQHFLIPHDSLGLISYTGWSESAFASQTAICPRKHHTPSVSNLLDLTRTIAVHVIDPLPAQRSRAMVARGLQTMMSGVEPQPCSIVQTSATASRSRDVQQCTVARAARCVSVRRWPPGRSRSRRAARE